MKPVMTRESIDEIFNGMAELLAKKNEDYKGASFDLGIDGNFVHIWDKVSRLRHLLDNRKSGCVPNFEGIEDTYRDLIGYCVIGLHILKSESDNRCGRDKMMSELDRIKKTYDDKYELNSEPMNDICTSFIDGVNWAKDNL